jgi:hypothetical protein
MNYLAGPLTRTQIPDLNKLVGADQLAASPAPVPAQTTAPVGQAVTALQQPLSTTATAPVASSTTVVGFSSTRPTIPAGIAEYFLPNNLTFTQAFKAAGREFPTEAFSQGLIYRPIILSQTSARLYNLKYKLDIDTYKTALVANPDRRGIVRWDNYPTNKIDPSSFDQAPDPQAHFAPVEAPLNDVRLMNSLEKDFLEWAYRTTQVTVRGNEELKIYAGPEISEGDFHAQCIKATQQALDSEIRKTSATYDTKLQTLNDKLEREQRALKQDQAVLSNRRMEVAGTVAETVAGLFGLGRKHSITSSISKQRMASQAKGHVEESANTIKDIQEQIALIEKEKADALQAVNDKWAEVADQITEIPIAAQKKDVLLDFFGVAWMPYHLVKIGDQLDELPGFSTK